MWWEKAWDNAFEGIKSILISSLVLSTPYFTKQFKLVMDASVAEIGGVLLQEDDGGIEKTLLFKKKIK